MDFSWDLLKELIRTNFKLKYKGSVLGFLWVLLKPTFVFLILYVIFVSLMKGSTRLSSREYALFLLIGMMFFNFFNEGILFGMNSLLDKGDIILKVKFNRLIAVASSIALALINFFVNLLIIAVVAAFIGVRITPISALYFLGIILAMLILVFAVSLFSSIILVRLRDLSHISELVLQLLFYASAIIIPVEAIPERFHYLVLLNPIAVYIQVARNAVMYGTVDRTSYMLAGVIASLLLLGIGILFFNKKVPKIAEYF